MTRRTTKTTAAKSTAYKKQVMDEFIEMMKEVDDLMIDNQIMCLPQEWQRIETFVPKHPHREKVTLYLDRAMVREFKKMGVNWQSYVRVILCGYLKLVKAGMLPSQTMDM